MGRKLKNIPVKDVMYIITNGKETEMNYFDMIRSEYQSIYKIKTKYLNDDPEGLVNYALELKDENNRVWCVFDKDYFKSESIYRAIQLAQRNDIGIAISNAAFEVWLINHIKYYEKESKAKDLVLILDSLLKENGYSQGYRKNDKTVLKKFFKDRVNKACDNAEILYQKRVLEFKQDEKNFGKALPVCEWNSFTTIHKLIENLKIL